MANDRAVGMAIFVGSILGIIVYGLLIYYRPLLTLIVTAFLGVLLLLAILAWIGYTMATTPPPEPIPDIQEQKPEERQNPVESEKKA